MCLYSNRVCLKLDKLSESCVYKTNIKHLVVCCVAIRLDWTEIMR